MTVEELKNELQQTLQIVKTYIDTKDKELSDKDVQLQGKLDEVEAKINGLELSPEDLEKLQEAIELLDNVDTEWVNSVNTKLRDVQSFLDGQLQLLSYSQQLFAIS